MNTKLSPGISRSLSVPAGNGANAPVSTQLRAPDLAQGPRTPTGTDTQRNPIAAEISRPPAWVASAGGVESHLLTRLAQKSSGVDRDAPISSAEAAQLFEYAHFNMGLLSGRLQPGLFSQVTVRPEFQKPTSAEVSASGRFYVPVSLGMNRPVAIIFEGSRGALTISTQGSNVRPGAATGFEGIPIKTSDGEIKRSEDLKGALAFKSEPAQYVWSRAAPQPISKSQAAELLRFANLNMGGVRGAAMPGLFEKVTISKPGMQPVSSEVDAVGNFSVGASLGMNQPITLTFEGRQGTLVINAESSNVRSGAATGFEGIPIKTSDGQIKRSEDLKGALAFESQSAEYRLTPGDPF